MKKNTMMRIASFLLIAVLITTSTISGTYAKYVTKADADDTARVAKWGVVIQADGKLYGEAYAEGDYTGGDDFGYTANSPMEDEMFASVRSDSQAYNLIAPGTKNDSGLTISLTGDPEVRTQVTTTVTWQNIYLIKGEYAVMVSAPTVTKTSWSADTYYTEAGGVYTLSDSFDPDADYYTMENYVDLSKDYYPVVYETTGEDEVGINSDSLGKVARSYIAKFNSEFLTYSASEEDPVGSTYSETVIATYDAKDYSFTDHFGIETMTWEWSFVNGSTEDEKDMYNGADTILGNLIVGDTLAGEVVKITTENGTTTIKAPTQHTDYNTTTSFEITITAEQVD